MTEENFEYSGTPELKETENSLPAYNSYLVNNIAKLVPKNKAEFRVLDFGSGIGTLATLLHDKVNAQVFCFEIDQEQSAECNRRGFRTFSDEKQLLEEKFDLIYSSNVLEHIEDDYAAVFKLHSILKDDGVIFTYVPAFNFLWTEMDTKVGHHRRYNKTQLRNLFLQNNFKIEKIRYVDCLGVLAMLLVKVIGFNSKSGLGNSTSLKFYDKIVWPTSKILDVVFKSLIGKNLLCIATKMGASDGR